MMEMPWQHPQLRDLVSALIAPGLIDHTAECYRGRTVDDAWCRGCYQLAVAELQRLDRNPAPLLQWIEARRATRLGRYFETLLEYWLVELLGYELVARNRVVNDGNRDLGEFDFLFRQHRDAAVVHWEAAVKFYLWFNGAFVGPNPQDGLQQKLARVFERQLLLGATEVAREQLAPVIGDDPVIPRAFIKGRLFYPIESDWRHPELIDGISTAHWRGWWCRQQQLSQWLDKRSRDHRWRLLPRRQWLTPYYSLDGKGVMTAVELRQSVASYFSSHHRALMVVEVEPRDGGWHQCSQGVIVSNEWPERLTAGA